MQVLNTYSMADRARRLQHIRTLLGNEPIPSQEALQHRLAERGIAVGQPTLSRDLRDLGVVKTPTGYRLPGVGETAPRLADSLSSALRSFVLSADRAGQTIVLRTGPGHAQPVALELDRTPMPGVLGTIAGDDTIFIAARSDSAARQTLAAIRTLADLR